MADDFDIYEDLPLSYNIKDDRACPENNESLSKECEELKKEVAELTSKLQELRKINETLEVNLSSLLKTAKAEIARKDKMIDELRRQVDNMSFRRGHFNRNIRKVNSKPEQQIPIPKTQEFNNMHSEDDSSTIQNIPVIKTKANVNPFDQDQNVSNHESFKNRCHDIKYCSANSTEPSKVSTTVFTERLRKRIIEEEEAEQKRKSEEKDKQNLSLENNHENNREINIDDKENQSQFSIWNSNVDNASLKCKGTEQVNTDNINNAEENAVCSTNQQRLDLSTKVSGKRADRDTDISGNKRRKLEIEENVHINKNSLPREEDVFNGYDHEIVPNPRVDKLNYEENTSIYIEKNNPHCNVQYDRDNLRLRSNDNSYKRKEHYKKSSSDYNYSRENTYYHEKDKYNHTRNKSPLPRYSDRKHKYHDDRYRDHRDRYDRRQNFHDKEEDASNISNKGFYDLRNKDKSRSNGKYDTTDFNSSRYKGSRYPDSHTSRSISHERSKSGSRERTSHKTYDRKSSKFAKNNNGSEEYVNVSLKRKDETNELKATFASRKKDDISEKSVKSNSIESSEDDNELLSPKLVDAHTTNNHASIKEEKSENKEYEKNENNDHIKTVESTIVDEIKIVNTSPEITNTPVAENKQDCTIKSIDIIVKKESKLDEHVVQHQVADKEAITTCDNMQNIPKDVMEARQKSNTNYTHKIESEKLGACNNLDTASNNYEKESNTSENKHSLSKNSVESQVPALGVLAAKPLQKKEDNNGNEHTEPKESESKKESSKRGDSNVIVFARRRKRVQLADTNASMTIVVNSNNVNSNIDVKNNTENNVKLRSCKISRSYKDVL
ncbi:hypothetical protein KPH14_003542 [Odynerus spinipes]|uniref:Uncharacterized protein n=1 Tax=Odynerus spinipes TaxID=1348599 RepID=A0AAD9RDH8_9HYME|nr:hypothetical protein KPH14_003542 [Odynerus spinipes]